MMSSSREIWMSWNLWHSTQSELIWFLFLYLSQAFIIIKMITSKISSNLDKEIIILLYIIMKYSFFIL